MIMIEWCKYIIYQHVLLGWTKHFGDDTNDNNTVFGLLSVPMWISI